MRESFASTIAIRGYDLIQGLKESSSEIHGTILTILMKVLEERAIERLLQKDAERYGRNGHQSKPRCLECSLGTISYRLAQVVDRQKEHTFMPLTEALSIPAYEHYLDYALEPPIGFSIHVSFRRATSDIERIQGQRMSHTTVHSRLQKFAHEHNPFGDLKGIPFQFLLVNGTRVHLQGAFGKDLGKVEMRWALASLGPERRFEPVGFWIDTDRAQIRKDLERRLNYKKLKILFSDGGPGIQENLLGKGMDHQRCLWHGKRGFPYLLYADGAKKANQAPFLDQLQSIPIMNLSKPQMERLRPEDRPLVVKQTQQGFQTLLDALSPQKYPRVRAYIENLIQPVTTFLSWWLKKGKIIPLNTNAIGSAFSHVCNRIKRVGRRWSEKGLLNWLQVVFYKIFKPDLWNLQWERKKRFLKIKLISIQATCY